MSSPTPVIDTEAQPATLKIGDRVVVKNTLLFTGRTGVLCPTSGHPDDFWDVYVLLDNTLEGSCSNAQLIGVSIDQIEHLTQEGVTPS